ncbi:MAG: LysM peptidoglycan-binding domain-containing protein [Spirochaetaceae bacterium]|nr:LysM peptidoglycan-binding domain-containing protein [Spirochaetaceae bacterium]
MNKALGAALVFMIMAAACKSAPAGETANSGEISEFELLEIYGDYNGIILDGAREYIVKYGDTLTRIARNWYGEDGAYYFPLIILASRSVIVDPDKITSGQRLLIPDLQANLDDPAARLQLKAMLLDIALVYAGKADATSGDLRIRNRKDRDGLLMLARSL